MTLPSQQQASDTIEVQHAVPSDQPNSVHDVADQLLGAYSIENGHAHLAGCTLDIVPVVRLSSENRESEIHIMFGQATTSGRLVDGELAGTLGLTDLSSSERPPSVSPAEVERLVTRARTLAETEAEADVATGEATLIWCKFVRGKVQLTIGGSVAQVGFADWARSLNPQPFHCEASGKDTFSVAATSDDRIVAAEDLGVCEVSGRRLPGSELVRCAATGRRVAGDLTTMCPVTRDAVLTSEFVQCAVCHQLVSPQALVGDQCKGCRQPSAVLRDDERLVRLLARFPELAGWRFLKLAETEHALIVTGRKILKQRMLVVNKVSLDLQHAARKDGFSRQWQPVPAGAMEKFW